MSEIVRIAEAMRQEPDYLRMSEEDLVIFVLRAIRDAPKSALWAGALFAKTDRDLEIWNAMIDEMLRE